MRSLLPLPLIFLGFASPAISQQTAADTAEAYRRSAESIDKDLRAALEELAALRDRIAAEKQPLSITSEKVAAELREKRRKADLARTSKEAAEAEFTKVDNDLKAWRDEKLYLESLFMDFRRSWETSKGVATIPAPGEPPGPADPSQSLDLAALVIGEMNQGGKLGTLPGEVVGPDGRLVPGTFLKAGPVHWFLSEDKQIAGLVGEGPDLNARLVNTNVSASSLDSLIQGGSADLIVDPTMGSAVALSETETDFLTHLKQGGFWVWPIILLAFIALVTAVIKWIQLAKIREFGSTSVKAVLQALNAGDSSEALGAAGSIRHPARNLLERGIHIVTDNPRASRDDLEEALFEQYLEATPPLQRGLPLIAIASATAPLLGLLGTVTGMMETFRLITVFGSGDAKSLASGISEALITTEFGLVVAIPALIAHSLLSRKVQSIKSAMEMTSLAFLNGIRNS